MQKLLLVYYYSENRATSRIWKVLPNMQVILDSPFARPDSAPIGDGKKGEFRAGRFFRPGSGTGLVHERRRAKRSGGKEPGEEVPRK